jgi:formamidopyrimidine-DNA glycosylase
MPELPEVERAARRIERAAVGKRIARLDVRHPSLVKRVPPELAARAVGRRIVEVTRRGKHQRLSLDDGSAIEVHFRMTGDWEVLKGEEPDPPYTRALIALEDGTRIALVDPRALGTLMLVDAGSSSLPELGPEPEDASFDDEYLARVLAKRRGPIKPVLLDQRVVAGVGNIYAAEALWEARISPRAIASRLSRARLREVVRALRAVLARSPAARYTDDSRGSRWRVYDREGARCQRCAGRIARITQAGRSTYYCPRCQRR